ncbi:hypothetical protein [Fuerstiella marisgermanici]|uniref:Uncharacterized protein n=1 Tax=Fuerstiella marisgermanici TaxID=1891926 RepID=A0A1P8WE11_9PLAN|nr:hypothetical protein [Fuerstiella marisgermanici]APZ92282.1 hypothetical protein Fuma_01892 [Fuerstiella marisgermanici]
MSAITSLLVRDANSARTAFWKIGRDCCDGDAGWTPGNPAEQKLAEWYNVWMVCRVAAIRGAQAAVHPVPVVC